MNQHHHHQSYLIDSAQLHDYPVLEIGKDLINLRSSYLVSPLIREQQPDRLGCLQYLNEPACLPVCLSRFKPLLKERERKKVSGCNAKVGWCRLWHELLPTTRGSFARISSYRRALSTCCSLTAHLIVTSRYNIN